MQRPVEITVDAAMLRQDEDAADLPTVAGGRGEGGELHEQRRHPRPLDERLHLGVRGRLPRARSAASITRGSRPRSPAVLRNTPAARARNPPRVRCPLAPATAHTTSSSCAPSHPTAERDALDRLHRDAALAAHPANSSKSRAYPRSASSSRCTAAAPNRTGSAPGSAGAFEATLVPCPVTPMNRTCPRSRASIAASSAPPGPSAVAHSSGSTRLCSCSRSTLSTCIRSSEWANCAAAASRVRSPVFVARKKRSTLTRHPRAHQPLGPPIARRDVDVLIRCAISRSSAERRTSRCPTPTLQRRRR